MMDKYFSLTADIDRSDKSKKLVRLISYTCIFISAKYCEKDSRGPTARDIQFLSSKAFREAEIIRSERNVLNVIGWDLMAATPIDFLNLFLNFGILYSDDLVRSVERSNSMEKPSKKTL